MTQALFELDRKVTRVWDLEVPVIYDQENKVLEAYLVGAIEEPCYYNELCHLLGKVTKDYTVKLYINTPGGVVDTAIMICNAIRKCEAPVVASITGSVASAGTIITMGCDDIEVDPHVAFMIHNYSGSMSGKGHEMKARQKFIDTHLSNVFKSYYSGFVTEEEIEDLLDGNDMWLGAEEVQTRWASRKQYLQENTNV